MGKWLALAVLLGCDGEKKTPTPPEPEVREAREVPTALE